MSFTKEDIDTYTRNILKSANTFKFSCTPDIDMATMRVVYKDGETDEIQNSNLSNQWQGADQKDTSK